jgi:hypothetical protein
MQCGDLDSMVYTTFHIFKDRPISPEFVGTLLNLPTHRVIKILKRLSSHGFVRCVTKKKVSFYKRI